MLFRWSKRNIFTRSLIAVVCIVALVGASFLFRAEDKVAQAAWYDSNWEYRISLTIPAEKISTEKVIFLTSGSTFTVPSDWNSSDNLIETVGGAGNGSDQTGGGGGGYSNISNQTLTPGGSVGYAVGGINGDTYFCSSTANCASIGGSAVIVGAKGGTSGFSGGTGGSSASGVGTVKTSGGNGGSGSADAGAGGGGAGGPDANGGNGGNGSGFTGGNGGNANGVSGTGGSGGTNQNKGERAHTNRGISGGGGGGSGHDDNAGAGASFGGGGGAKGNDASGSDASGEPGGIKLTYSATSTLTDFPVYVDLSDLPQHVWDNLRSDCGDIRVTTSNGSTEVPREIVSCDSTGQTGEMHFKAPSVTSASDNTFYIYYGNSGQADYAIDATYGAENVWTNAYQAVYHFESNSSLVDSTANDRDGIVSGTVSTTTGKLAGSSFDFEGSDDFASTTNDFSLGSNDYSIQFWFNADAVSPNADSSSAPVPLSFRNQYNYFLTFGDTAAGDALGIRYTDGSYQTSVAASSIATDTWYQWTSTFSSTTGTTLFFDGSLLEADGDTDAPTASANSNIIGGYAPSGSSGRSYDGSMDELRISSTTRSKAWVEAEYQNQSSPTGFYAIGGVGGGSTQRVFLTSGTSWTVPSDWSSASNTVEVIGGGGGGASYVATDGGYGGGGGGAYSKSTNISLTPGANVTYAIGSGGGAASAGGDSYICNSTSDCASIAGGSVVVGAKGGSGASGGTGGAGGASASGVGSTKNTGGTGGNGSSGGTPWGGGGGGGAAGPNGNGANGGNGGNQGGGGGGGNGGGTAGSGGGTNNGGAGGNNSGGSGSGAGGTSGVDGANGTNGGGGGGGYGGSPNTNGGDGGAGNEWSTHGSGGGGGASGDSATAKVPGDGGLYGGGGGGAAADSGTTGGSGSQGVIVITYEEANTAPENPQFETTPYNTGTSTISMLATSTDSSGYIETESGTYAEYYFTNNNTACGSNAGTGGSDSGWLATSTYTDTGLQANKCYGYTVTARDGLGGVSSTSTASSTYTSAAVPGAPVLSSVATSSFVITNTENGNPSSNPTTAFAVQLINSSPTDATWDDQYVDASGDPSASEVWLTDAQIDNLTINNLNDNTYFEVRVKARNQDNDETTFSSVTSTTTPTADTTPPTPNPPIFSSAPSNDSTSAISMTATAGSDAYGSTPIEYYFALDNSSCGANAGSGGDSSGWQTSTSYTDSGLQTNKCYGYTLTMRDSLGNTTSTSTASTSYTSAETPGAPVIQDQDAYTETLGIFSHNDGGNPITNPQTEFALQVNNSIPTDATWDGMYIDASGNPSASAVWLADSVWDTMVLQGVASQTVYQIRSKARNGDGDETPFGSSGTGNTVAATPNDVRMRGGGIRLQGGARIQ